MTSDRSASPRLSVVVCSRDRPDMLALCLESLAGILRPHDEVVVVDSCSKDNATRETAEKVGFRVVRSERPGLSRARNVGARAAGAPLVAFTDDDCLVREGWTEIVERSFDDPTVGFVSGRVVADTEHKLPLAVSSHAEPATFSLDSADSAICHGANMAVRRLALDTIGGFDEALGAGGRFRAAEDDDALRRLLRHGWTARYEPAAVVVHRQWRTLGEALRTKYGYGIGVGAFAAKAARLEGAPGRALLRHQLWKKGLVLAGRHLLAGYESGAIAVMAGTAGVIVGAARGWRTPLIGERYRT